MGEFTTFKENGRKAWTESAECVYTSHQMALYLVSYDLRENRDYKRLYDELESFDAVRVLDSSWYFDRPNTTKELMAEHFKEFVGAEDGLVVAEVGEWITRKRGDTPS